MAAGKFPFSRKISHKEINRLILEGEYPWLICNDEISPRLSLSIEREEVNKKGKPKKIFFSMSANGFIYITGAKSKKEIENLYESILNEINRLCPTLLQ